MPRIRGAIEAISVASDARVRRRSGPTANMTSQRRPENSILQPGAVGIDPATLS